MEQSQNKDGQVATVSDACDGGIMKFLQNHVALALFFDQF